MSYIHELTKTEVAEFFRPNFWPNTPDILAGHLQYHQRPAFILRYVLAATLSSNYGIYGPAFELCENVPFPDKEEYVDNEKYEIKKWDWDRKGNLKDIIAKVNQIRKNNTSLHFTKNVRFCDIANDNIIAYYKVSEDLSNIVLIVVNLDSNNTQSGWIRLPLDEWGIDKNRDYTVLEMLSDHKFVWKGESNFIELNPQTSPAHIILIR